MIITHWTPKRSLMNFQNDSNLLFDYFNNFHSDAEKSECYFCPVVDIDEQDKHFSVYMELPGVKKIDINISIKDNILTIAGEKKTGEESNSKNYHRSERIFGKFKRSFSLDELVDRDNISAEFENGMLNITIPKVKETKPKQLAIKIK
ncbi:MAG TPA: hypothetical protein DHW42_07715 [Candidatus Marinimicrobia bacterium]|nr:hypothetical protein [Candidatus Neomarinimicrobiota bacterium]